MNDDWYEMLVALLDNDVRFLVVGAHALAVHGVSRGTQDIDLWIDPSAENAGRVWQALSDFQAPADALGITLDDLQRPGTVVQFGLPPNRIDLLTAVSGVDTFEAAWRTRVRQTVRGRAIPFLGREALIQNKLASGRRKDLADVEALGESTRLPSGPEQA